jgi:hypothetical protein
MHIMFVQLTELCSDCVLDRITKSTFCKIVPDCSIGVGALRRPSRIAIVERVSLFIRSRFRSKIVDGKTKARFKA